MRRWTVGLATRLVLGIVFHDGCGPALCAPSGACAAAPAGLVAFWPLDATEADALGVSPLTLLGEPMFVPGQVEGSLQFDGLDDGALASFPSATYLSAGPGLSVELWVKPLQVSPPASLVEWNDGNLLGLSLSISRNPTGAAPGTIFVYLADTAGVAHRLTTAGGLIESNVFQHVAFTYDKASGVVRIYRNGQLLVDQAMGSFTLRLPAEVRLGHRLGAGDFFHGLLDEVSVYNRALDATEVRAIAEAQARGKCREGVSPTILQSPQPPRTNNVVGETASFAALAAGLPAPAFQWLHAGVPVPGQTNATLVLTNVQLHQAGDYSLSATNVSGAATSAVATLVVRPVPVCAPPPAGLVAWWPLENNGTDVAGVHPLQMPGVLSFPVGRVGRGVRVDRADVVIRAAATPALDLGTGAGFTVELWINPVDRTNARPLLEWHGPAGPGVQMWSSRTAGEQGGPGCLFASVKDVQGTDHALASAPGLLVGNFFQHVALTYDRATGLAQLFVDGQMAAERLIGDIVPDTRGDVFLGWRTAGEFFGGTLDEVTLYARALSAAELQGIFFAWSEGKCRGPVPPFLTRTPQGAAVFAGDAWILTAEAVGELPLRYQWFFNEQPLPGATNATLLVGDIRSAQAGDYTVRATNIAGMVVSAAAMITLRPAPPCAPPPAGLVAWWPMAGTAQDVVGTNHFVPPDSVTFVDGRAGQALHFDRLNEFATAPAAAALNLGANAGLTVEFWVKPSGAVLLGGTLVAWQAPLGGQGVRILTLPDAGVPWRGNVYVNLVDTQQASHLIASPADALLGEGFNHVAVTYQKSGGTARIYVNGLLASERVLGVFTPETRGPVVLGGIVGSLDEIAFYDRSLSAAEIQAIYNAITAGKCRAPLPPQLITQPYDIVACAGKAVRWEARAAGDLPLAFAWSFNGTLLPQETNSSLVRSNIQPGDAGYYAVRVSSSVGVAMSSNALITVLTQSVCMPASAGLTAWWPLGGHGGSLVGDNIIAFWGAPSLGPGVVGDAMRFDGVDDAGRVFASPATDLGAGPGFTIELWAKPANFTSMPLVEWNNNQGTAGLHLWVNANGPGSVWAGLYGTTGQTFWITTATGLVSTGFTHVALTYDRTTAVARIFVNGNEASRSVFADLTMDTRADVYFGGRPFFGGFQFLYRGVLDEITFYRRALAPAEMEAIYCAGSEGKCRQYTPFIFQQPQSVAVEVGESARFDVWAGEMPLSYRWQFNGMPMAGQTNTTLFIDNVQLGQAGEYSVIVGNSLGVVLSSNATLTVQPAPACLPLPLGITAAWPLDGSGTDLLGTNRMKLVAGAHYAHGQLNEGLYLNGWNDEGFVPAAPALDLGAGPGLTVEFWMTPEDEDDRAALVSWHDSLGHVGANLCMSLTEDASLDADLIDRQGASHALSTRIGVLSDWPFRHVALTYDQASGQARIYLDGEIVAESNLGSFVVETRYDVHFGKAPPTMGSYFFTGILDEIAFYQRALSAEEIVAIAGARRSGKCRTPCSPAPRLDLVRVDGSYLIRWDGVGTLQTAPEITGPWANVETAVNWLAVAAGGAQQFFRVVCP